MIPRKLELTNFLSYRDTATLCFDGIHLACISGLNGAGKSTLLDAMTWALFGRSRSRSDDDLVNRIAALTGSYAEVRFEFELEGACYRVIRRKRPGRAAELEFQIQKGPDQWQTLTEGKLRDTQAAIEHLLRMNFDTFINASFFLQGKADEFTTKTAGKRKEILADLLGVTQWNRYKEAAAERRKAEEKQLLLLDQRLEDIEAELQEEDARRSALDQARADHEAIASQLKVREELLKELRRTAEAARQQEQTAKKLKEMLLRQQAELARSQQRRTVREQERQQHQVLLDQTEAIQADQQAYEQAEQVWQGWQEKEAQFNRLQQARRPHELKLEGERNRLREQQKTLQAQAEQVRRLLAERDTVQQQLAAAQAAQQAAQEQLAALAAQEQRWHEARSALQALEAERKLWEQELGQLRNKAKTAGQQQQERSTVQANLAAAETALRTAEEKLQQLAEQRQRHPVALADRDRLQQEQEALKTEGQKLRERLDRLQDDDSGECCPVCGQPLSEAHRQKVLTDLTADREALLAQYQDNRAQLEKLLVEIPALEEGLKQAGRLEQEQQTQRDRRARAQARLEEIERALAEWEAEGPAQLATLETQLADRGTLEAAQAEVQQLGKPLQEKAKLEQARQQQESTVAKAEARLAEIARAEEQWQTVGQAALEAVQHKLETNEIAPEAQAALVELDAQAEALGYDPAAHQAARAEKERLAEAPGRYQALKQAEAAIKPLDESLADLAEQIAAQQASIADLSQQHEEALSQLENLRANGGDLAAVENEVMALREQEIAANQRIGAAQQRLHVLETRRQEREAHRQKRAELTLLIQRLERLEKACGRDGIQALLIERAVPEIEMDANELLDRLSGGAMRVVIDTQKQLKSRDALAETLDIRISDPAGERPYENFSGGEQFRVNFAIRLALSRVLARRAGARLQTLVIDEGFGSQDLNGRQRLVEAINTIQGDFERILVITHVDELRDAFQRRIEVEKGPAGSIISVI